jgi:hypothetical protein
MTVTASGERVVVIADETYSNENNTTNVRMTMGTDERPPTN